MRFSKERLLSLYVIQGKSARDIAKILTCSENKINYWLKTFGIKKRTISESIYKHKNPKGDPFVLPRIQVTDEAFLYGLGVGLFWGEGNKKDRYAVRLGNTDPNLIKRFVEFLEKIYKIDRNKLHFGLQIFNDVSPDTALNYWIDTLGVSKNAFQKIVVSQIRGKGTYKNKSKHGVLTVYFYNKKLRDEIHRVIEKLS